ncbi:MAG: ABC transporter permease [Bacteroidota bacterium]
MEVIHLSWTQLLTAYLALLIPALILWYYGTGLVMKLAIATFRMTAQLIFVGYYLEYLFAYDNPWLNAGWIIVMIVVADWATTDRSELKLKPLFVPIFIATFIGIGLIDLFFLEIIIDLPHLLAAQYAIPITGMILGNCLKSNVIGLRAFYYALYEQKERYQFYLCSGAARFEAVKPFFRSALQEAANPTLASMATIGLVSLPGMMTGQILGGSPPMVAIQYQILISIAIFAGTIFSVFLAIWISNYVVFDERDRFDDDVLTQ